MSTNNTVLVPKVQFGSDEKRPYGNVLSQSQDIVSSILRVIVFVVESFIDNGTGMCMCRNSVALFCIENYLAVTIK